MPKGDARKGNGGWGGPAKGKGRGDGIPKPWTKDTPTLTTIPGAKGIITAAKLSRIEREARNAERLEQLHTNLMKIALEGETENNRLSATVAAINRLEGMPVSRNIHEGAGNGPIEISVISRVIVDPKKSGE